MARVNYRCRRKACRKRYTFHKPIESYVRTPSGLNEDLTCGLCGAGLALTRKHLVRQRKRDTGICRCSLVPVPHRRGCVGVTLNKHAGVYSCEAAPVDPFDLGGVTLPPSKDCPF